MSSPSIAPLAAVSPDFTPLEGSAPLAHWGLIRARGQDAAAFLHGQLTNDFVLLDLNHARLAGYCSAKGRLLASFIGWKVAPDEILLACRADLLASTLKRLSMFVLRAQCKLSDATPEFQMRGLAGQSARAALGEQAPCAPWSVARIESAYVVALPEALSGPRYLWVAPPEQAVPTLAELTPDLWLRGEVCSGVASVEQATADQFVPQMLNYELLGGVDFKKGCYPGQEVVARSQYRGTIKRRTALFAVDGPIAAAQEIFHSDDPSQPAGMVVNAAPSIDHRSCALVEVKLAALATGRLHLGTPSGPTLAPLSMPYALPVEAVTE